MVIDPVVEELHKHREEYMERFRYDFDAIVRDIRAHEASSSSPLLQPPSEPGAAPHSDRALRKRRW
jgi:hypothetical protein